jgi:hypothetical protein
MKIEEKIQELEKQIESLKNESKKEEMEQLIKSLLNGLEIEINDNKPNSVFYKKNKKYLFYLYQDPNYKEERCFYCNYNLVWPILEYKYNLNHDEIEYFIRSMVEQHLKLGKVSVLWLNFTQPLW